jgi:hypothetical protein
MEGFIEGVNRGRTKLFPGRLKDLIGEEHVVGVADLFVEKLDLLGLGFVRSNTGQNRPEPAVQAFTRQFC